MKSLIGRGEIFNGPSFGAVETGKASGMEAFSVFRK
jgi:hypothetical protein